MRKDIDFEDGCIKNANGIKESMVTIEFTKDRDGEILTLTCDGVMIGVNYATIERMVNRTRKGTF